MKKVDHIIYWINAEPFSADPIHYDYSIHHSIYRSVLSSLTSNYSNGNITGVLAKSWKNSVDYKEWIVELKENIKFENGDLITPEIVVLSLKRIAYLLKQKKSQEGFLDKLLGIERLTSIDKNIQGLTINGNKIIFKFNDPIPSFLNHLSFGIYSIVHPRNYSHLNGQWINPFNVIASGPYKIKSQHEKEINLEKNENFDQSIGHPNKFDKITITWDATKEQTADLFRGTSLDNKPADIYSYSGGLKSGIAFIRCHSYKSSKSPFYDLGYRQKVRNTIYKLLNENGFEITTSFFPPGTFGLEESNYNFEQNVLLNVEKILYRGFNNKRFKFSSMLDRIIAKNLRGEINNSITLKNIMYEISDQKDNYLVDLVGIASGILVDEPKDDIVFMFNSSTGIQLPDISGKIREELSKNDFNINVINQELWEQAVIWPIAHFSNGLYYKSFIDLSYSNLIQPPIDFAWIGSK